MLPESYQQNSSGVWTRTDTPSFDYSDGDDVENRLLQQLQEANDVSVASDELQRLMVDWPSEYHFSPFRANLLSSFSLDQFNYILEIGSGCGAITRVLGEQCPSSQIIALEGSMRRAEITQARCRGLSNVNVCRDSFTDFLHDDPFDLITMIGVLEYSPSYFDGNDPILKALQRAYRMLSANGVLVIAIENQLGLKYFNGCSEDHTGKPFVGINDLYRPGTVQTFGKRQLQEQIETAGFGRVEFVYPFPDYKLPQLLLREESFQCNELDLSHLAGQYPSRDYGYDSEKIFQEARAWRLLSENGLLRDLANSFLVFGFAGDKTLKDLTDPWLAKAFSGRRKKRYLIETVFTKGQDEVEVEKRICYPAAVDQIASAAENIVHHVGKADYIQGVPYEHFLQQQVSEEEPFSKFIKFLTPWVEWLRAESFFQTTDGGEEKLMVSGKLYDCMPANILIGAKEQICIIDQEWEYDEPLELGFVLFRGLYRQIYANIAFFEQIDLFPDGTVWDLFKQIYENFDLPFNEDIFAAYVDLEITLQLELVPYSTDKDGLKTQIQSFFTEARQRRATVGEFLITGGIREYSSLLWQKKMLVQALAEREEQLTNLNKCLVERDETLSTILESSSWRITAPLRLAGHVIKGDFKKAATVGMEMKQSLDSITKRLSSGFLRDKNKKVD